MTGGPPIVFTRKTAVDQTYICNSSNVCRKQLELTQFAKRCRPDFTKHGSMTLKLISFKLGITEKEVSRTWFVLLSRVETRVKIESF